MKPKICHITYHNCIRVIKETTVLRNKGYTVSLFTGRMNYGWNSCMFSGGSSYYSSVEELKYLIKNSDADIFHCHNTPDDLAKIAVEMGKKVVWDIHDLDTLKFGSSTENEKFLFQNVSGIVQVSEPIMDYCTKLFNPKCPQIVLYSCLPKELVNNIIDYDIGKKNTVVYEGNVWNDKDGSIPGGNHRNYIDIAKSFENAGYEFHIYPVGINVNDYKALGIRTHDTIEDYESMLKEIKQYKFGFCGFPIKKQILEWCLPNKLFEYTAMGLPVIVYNADLVSKWVHKYNIGIVLNNLEDIKHNPLLEDDINYVEMLMSIEEFNEKFTMDNQIIKLEELYEKIYSSL